MPATKGSDYLTARPERLLVQALRLSLAGYYYEDCLCWQAARTIAAREVGPAAASRLLEGVQPTAQLLWQLRGSGLRIYPSACRCLSRDECMMIAASAAAQHADDEALNLAVEGLLLRKAAPRFAVVLAAGFRQIADAMERAGEHLLEVPVHVVSAILEASPDARIH